MPRHRVNLDQGVVGMTDPGSDPVSLIGDGYIQSYDGGLESETADEDILRDKDGKKLYVRVIHTIDRKMKKAGYVPLTHGICDICSTKLVRNFSKLSPMQKEAVKKKLADHKAAVHKLSQATVITEDEFKNENRSWLGNR